MRNLFILIALALTASTVSYTHAESDSAESVAMPDSTVAVIAWFNKRDTVTYWINEGEWKIKGTDTIKSAGINTKVMLTVADSTDEGYTMEYQFLNFQGDALADSELGALQNRIAEKLGKKIIGTKIRFHTDEYGTITKYDNLNHIKKQAKSLFKEASKELLVLPVVDSLKSIGFDISKYIKKVDPDQLVQGYLEELELLFLCHGNIYELGESSIHEDETDTQYASDTYNTASIDPETQNYSITCQVDSEIPQEALKSIVGAIVDEFSDAEITKNFNETFDTQVKGGAVTTYVSITYFPDGWPTDVVKQTKVTVGPTSKINQTYITWDYRSTGHQN